jgi:hypothetical protein
MSKHLVDIDDRKLELARAALNTDTIKATVDVALAHAAERHLEDLDRRLATLVEVEFDERDDGWR